MNSTAKGTALGMFFGGIAFLITKFLVGHIGWQTAVAGTVGILFGRAVAGDLDDKPIQAQAPVINPSNTPTTSLSEAEQLNDFAFQLSMAGNLKQAMELWTKSALAGVPNALASYCWYALRDGKFSDGITLYEASIEKISKSRDKYQIANCKGNYALLIAAESADYTKSISILKETLDEKQYEAHFFLAMLEYKYGSKTVAFEIVEKIPSSELQVISNTLVEESLNASGWFKNWCSEGREIFDLLTNQKE